MTWTKTTTQDSIKTISKIKQSFYKFISININCIFYFWEWAAYHGTGKVQWYWQKGLALPRRLLEVVREYVRLQWIACKPQRWSKSRVPPGRLRSRGHRELPLVPSQTYFLTISLETSKIVKQCFSEKWINLLIIKYRHACEIK